MINISEIFTTIPQDQRGSLENKTYQALSAYNIPFERVDNDSVTSMEDCVDISKKLGTEIRKSILVTNRKKTAFYLVVMPADKSFDTKTFCNKLDVERVSFASGDTMINVLGVAPGSLSIMSVLNDETNKVKVVIDKTVAEEEYFACNPGANTTHIKIKTKDLLENFLVNTKHKAIILSL